MYNCKSLSLNRRFFNQYNFKSTSFYLSGILLCVLFVFSILLLKEKILVTNGNDVAKSSIISQKVDVATFSSNGELVATLDKSDLIADKESIKIWRTSDGRLLSKTPKHEVFYDLVFSPSGKYLASSGYNGVWLWDTASGHLIWHTLKGKTIFSIAFSPNEQSIASGSMDGIVREIRMTDGSIEREHIAKCWVGSIAYNNDGDILASGCEAVRGLSLTVSDELNPILLWRIADGKLLTRMEGHKYETRHLAFSSDGKTLVSGGDDGLVKLWNIEKGVLIKTIQFESNLCRRFFGESVQVTSLSLNKGSNKFAASISCGQIFWLDMVDFRVLNTYYESTDFVPALLTKNENEIISINSNGIINFRSIKKL